MQDIGWLKEDGRRAKSKQAKQKGPKGGMARIQHGGASNWGWRKEEAGAGAAVAHELEGRAEEKGGAALNISQGEGERRRKETGGKTRRRKDERTGSPHQWPRHVQNAKGEMGGRQSKTRGGARQGKGGNLCGRNGGWMLMALGVALTARSEVFKDWERVEGGAGHIGRMDVAGGEGYGTNQYEGKSPLTAALHTEEGREKWRTQAATPTGLGCTRGCHSCTETVRCRGGEAQKSLRTWMKVEQGVGQRGSGNGSDRAGSWNDCAGSEEGDWMEVEQGVGQGGPKNGSDRAGSWNDRAGSEEGAWMKVGQGAGQGGGEKESDRAGSWSDRAGSEKRSRQRKGASCRHSDE